MATPPIPGWFKTALREGLSTLYALNLEGCPAADVFEATARVWEQDLWAFMAPSDPKPDTDTPRIAAAFRSMRLELRRWPAPRVFRDHLRPRNVPRPPALPNPGLSAEEIQHRLVRNAQRRAALLGDPLPEATEGQVP